MDIPKPWCSINTISSLHLLCHCDDLGLCRYCFIFALGSGNVVQADCNHWNSSTPSVSTVKTPNGSTMHTYIIFPSHKHSAKGLKSDSIAGAFHTTCGSTRCYHQSEEDGGSGGVNSTGKETDSVTLAFMGPLSPRGRISTCMSDSLRDTGAHPQRSSEGYTQHSGSIFLK